MNNKLPTIHLILFILLLVVAGVLFWFTQRELARQNFIEAEIKSLVENRTRLDSITTQLAGLSADETAWQLYLPKNEQDVATFASDLEEVASNNSVTMTLDFDDFPGQVDIGGKYVTGLGLTMTLEGSYQGLTGFMSGIGKLPYFYKTDKITVLKHEINPGIKATIKGSLITGQI